MSAQQTLERFDSARLGPFHTRILLITGSCWLWAAYGVAIIGFIIPVLKTEWQVSSTALGVIAGSGMMGMMPGSILAGMLADRIGRRAALAWTMVYLTITFVLSSFAWDFSSMLVLRILNGLGLGAVLPIASTLVSEYSPARYRGRLLVLLNGFWGLGGVVAALAGYLLIPRFGWHSGLLLGAAAVLSLPLVLAYVPESLRFLFTKGRHAEVDRALRMVSPDESHELTAQPATAPKASAGNDGSSEQPWSSRYRKRTLSLWFFWIALNFVFQGVFIWLPTILLAAGHPAKQASMLTLIITMGQIPGTLLGAYLADASSRRRLVMLSLVAFGASTAFFGFSTSVAAALTWGFLIAVWNGVLWGMAYPFTTELYPTAMRAAATGWATGAGRIGGIAAPLVVGSLIQAQAGNAVIFSIIGSLPVLAVLVLLGVREETTGKVLEEITG